MKIENVDILSDVNEVSTRFVQRCVPSIQLDELCPMVCSDFS